MTTLARPPLHRLTRVELRKLVDTRAGFWLLASTGLLTVAVAVIAALVLEGEDQSLLNLLAVTVQPASILMPVAGILLVTSEWSQRTAITTFALVPDRARVLTAKALAGVTVAVAAFALCVVIALVVAVAFDATSMSLSAALIGQALFSVVVPMVAGVAFGAALLASAPAIVASFVLPTAWAAIGSIHALHDAARWLDQTRTMTPLLEESLSGIQWARVGTSLALWLLLPLAIGTWRIVRSDPK